MRFTVTGTDAETGQAVELTVEARDADMAERFAAKRQINVTKVSIAKQQTPSAAEPVAAVETAPSSPAVERWSSPPPPPAVPVPAARTGMAAGPQPSVAPMAPVAAASPTVPAGQSTPVILPLAPAAAAAPPRPAPIPAPAAQSSPQSFSPVLAPIPSRQRVVIGGRPGRGLALAAMVLGLIALLFCWIPVISLLSMPLSGIGLLLAIIAGVVVIVKKHGSMVLPVAGMAVCGLCLFVTLMVTSATINAVTSAADQMKREMERQNVQATRKETEQKAPRNLSVVAVSLKNGATIPALSLEPASSAVPGQLPPDMTDVGKPVVVGEVEISVKRVALESVTLVGDDGSLQGESEKAFLTLKIEVKNLGKEAITYRTLAAEEMSSGGATLKDDLGRLYPAVTFGHTARPAGRAGRELLEPGGGASDVLVFQAATLGGKPRWLELEIPGKALGGDHKVIAKVSADALR